MTVVVSWPAWRLYQVVTAGGAKTTVAETARYLHLSEAVAFDALVELHRAGIVPAAALAAAAREREDGRLG